jgi:hypothetical protein
MGRNIPRELCQDVRNAYDLRSRDALEAALARIEAMLSYAGPPQVKESPPEGPEAVTFGLTDPVP